MFYEIIAIGGFFFWTIAAIAFIAILIAAGFDSARWAFAVALGFMAVLWLWSPFNPFAWAVLNWGTVLKYAIGYVVLGVVYSFFKWWLQVNKALRKMKEYESGHRQSYANKPDEYIASTTFREYLIDKGVLPTASQNKEAFVTWTAFWPASLFLSFFQDILIELWRWLVEQFKGIYETIENMVYGDLK